MVQSKSVKRDYRIFIVFIVVVSLVFSFFVSATSSLETADSETINTGSLDAGGVSDTRTNNSVSKDMQEDNIGGGGPNADYQLNAEEFFSTTLDPEKVTKLEIITNSWTNGENFQVLVYNYSSGSYVPTLISVSASSDGTTYTSSICSSGCDISGNPRNFVDSAGNMQLQYLDSVSGEGKSKNQGDILSIDYQAINITVDDEAPEINLISPQNDTTEKAGTFNFVANFTESDSELDNSTLYIWNSSGIVSQNPEEISGSQNQSNISSTLSSSGIYYWNYFSCDNLGNCNFSSQNYTLNIDSVPPKINITFPENNSNHSTNTLNVNYTVSDDLSGISGCWYSNDSFSENYSLINCENITNVFWSEGFHDVKIWVNDTLGNINSSEIYFTIDTKGPKTFLDFPKEGEIINSTSYLLNASSSYDVTSSIENASWYWYNSTDSGIIGTDTTPEDGLTYNWNVGISDGKYDISVNVSDNLGNENSSKNKNITIDVKNENPLCQIIFPNGNENLSKNVLINSSAYDPDPSDFVKDVSFEYSPDDGNNWYFIETNESNNLDYYAVDWNTSLDVDSEEYLVRCNVTDSRGGESFDNSDNNFTIDNTPPRIYNESVEKTEVQTNNYNCLNVSVVDNIVGVKNVKAEIDYPEGRENVTLNDNGEGCDVVAGDNVYSIDYQVLYSGDYNWTKTYTKDNQNNTNSTITDINWTGSTDAYLIGEMLSPSGNIEINESGTNSNYTQQCNITCNASGGVCYSVTMDADYYDSQWNAINPNSGAFYSNEYNYSCGDLNPGESCLHTFNISANNSGGNTYPVRCHGTSENAAADFSSSIDVHVNDFPYSLFSYPLDSEWLHGIETLNASDSYDADGSIVNYKFELDNNTEFTSPDILCDSSSETCSFNTTIQTQCQEESSNCYLKLTTKDDDFTKNSSIIQIGIDDTGPLTNLDKPKNNSFITSENQLINASASDLGSGVDCVEFGYSSDNGDSWNFIASDCSFPFEYNWDLSLISDGVLRVRTRANDTEGNFGSYDVHGNITYDTNAPDIDLYYPNNSEYFDENSLVFNFSSKDNLADNLECELLVDNIVNKTNYSVKNNTITNFNVSDISEGLHNWNVNCTDNAGNENSSKQRNFKIDLTSPYWSNQNQTINRNHSNIYHKGQIMNLSVFWKDNINLDKAWISTNETGIWKNKTLYDSPQNLTSNESLSDFNWSNNSLNPGNIVSWKVYTNDSAGNVNITDEMNFRIWSYSEISESYLSPSGVEKGENTTMYCKVNDNITNENLENYKVYFYDESGLIGTNFTMSNGYAKYTFNENQAGSYNIICNITDNSSIYYNASSDNQGGATLGVGYGFSIYDYTNTTYNRADEGTNVNDTSVYPGIDESYSVLTSNDGNFQSFQAPEGEYAFTRFSFKINEEPNEITELNMTWSGRGEVSTGTNGFILYLYNTSSGQWKQEVTYTTDNTEQLENITYNKSFSDFVDSNGWVKVLARTYSPAPTTSNPRTATIYTDYIKLEIKSDIISPSVSLISPVNYYNSSSTDLRFNCSVSDDNYVQNISLYGNWSTSGWEKNETNSSSINPGNYSFDKSIEEGNYLWNCYACDKAGNCDFSTRNRSFKVDLTPPNVSLIYPEDNYNFSGYKIDSFNFSSLDNNKVKNCSLYGNWSVSEWHENQTLRNIGDGREYNFSGINVSGDGFYSWNVKCYDYAGNSAFNKTNFSFAAFLPPEIISQESFNITQTENNGKGNITLYWNSSNHSKKYEIYYTEDLSQSFSYLNETSNTNFTDTTFKDSGDKRRFYRIDATNPSGENSSLDYLGVHIYELAHAGASEGTSNWIGFPTNFTYLKDANDTLNNIRNATTFSMWNASIQKRVTCNEFSCPSDFECTSTNCNFDLKNGRGYEVNVNSSASQRINWSGVGIVKDPVQVELKLNQSSFHKNWISMYANTSLSDGLELIKNISNAESVSSWNSTSQSSRGIIPAPSWLKKRGIDYIAYKGGFNVTPEKGYEVSVTQNTNWTQV